MTRWLAILVAIALTPACNQQPPAEADAAAADSGSFERIVTLAPHLAEFVFAVGAGDKLVGVSAYSDFPPEVAGIPVVSDAFTVDQEQLALLEPDLVLAWQSGTPAALVDDLRTAGYNVVVVASRNLDDIANALADIGQLVGRPDEGDAVAMGFVAAVMNIKNRNSDKAEISVFFQVSSRPLYTVSGQHYISEIIELCGGRNIFEELGELAPTVDVEAVIALNPEVFLAGSFDGALPFDDWDHWPTIAANHLGNRFVVSADAIGRPSLRVVDAAREVCESLDAARFNRQEAASG